jgi:hypothetical protein
MVYLDVGFEGSHMLWKANLETGWNDGGYFKEIENLAYPAELTLRCELRVYGRGEFGGITSFPHDLKATKEDDAISLEISTGRMRLLLKYWKAQLQWFNKIKKAGLVNEFNIMIGFGVLNVVALATFIPPRKMHVPDVYVWDTIGPSAGLPTLGKRR